MTNKGKIIAAIDIGSSKITTLVAQVATDAITYENSLHIVGVSSLPSRGVKKGQIVDIEDAVETTIASVEAAERMAGYNLNSAWVAVGGAHVSSQNSTGVVAVSDPNGEVSGADVSRVIEAARAVSMPASREIIHVIPRDFIVDGEGGVKDPIGMAGVRLEVETHLVTASSPALKNLTKTVNEVGISTEGVVFSAIASARAVLSDTEKELGCVLIDIGAGTTSIAAWVDGGLVYSGALPVGARNVTNDLAIGLRVSIETAEKIKLSLSNLAKSKDTSAKSDVVEVTDPDTGETKKVSKRTLTEGIIRPRLNEIFTMIRLDLERNGIINKIPSGAVITGGGAETVGVIDSAKRMLTLPVRIGIPTGVTGLVDEILNCQYATAIGLLEYGLDQGMPQNVKENKMSKMKLPNSNILGKVIDSIRDLLP
ncbi:cell division protein FtsA [soil metagenome]